MLTKRIIPCLDVANNQVVKGVRFRDLEVVGDIIPLAQYYSDSGADELVFYDIKASAEGRTVSLEWINSIAAAINIPFTVAGGIRSFDDAKAVLQNGADKISINTPALENPQLIDKLSACFGNQCIVIGVDSRFEDDDYYVYQFTGDASKTHNSQRKTRDWIKEVQDRGAGEIVLNCMNADGVRTGYDIEQVQTMTQNCLVPLIASGGAGCSQDFVDLFVQTKASGALAASIFHKKIVSIKDVKSALNSSKIEVRI